MPFPSKTGPNSYIWNLKQVYVARQGDNWPGPGNIGLFGGGTSPNQTNVINYINITSAGNATDFGDLIGTANKNLGSMGSSTTRGVFVGGHTDGSYTGGVNVIQYITFATTGNSTDFGDSLINAERRASSSGGSNQTRGINFGGFTFSGDIFYNVMEYITFASVGNATDFGDLINPTLQMAQCGSNTRAVVAGGLSPGSTFQNVIQYVTITTTGNATDFGDLTVARGNGGAASSSTRGTFAGGYSPVVQNVIDFITIASAGNATDFGDLITATYRFAGVSNTNRGVFGGGLNPAVRTNVIQFITIATTGNATDFGDLITATADLAGSSNGHGGLN
jgi:hypothetical protein